VEPFPIAVIVERLQLSGRWGGERWETVGVLPDFAVRESDPGAPAQRLFGDGEREQFRVAGLALELFRDEAEGYFLNLSSPVPKVFVMLRLEDGFARPVLATASYAEGARLIDSGEQVDGVAMPREIADWLGDFVNTHYKPEPRRKMRRNDPFAEPAAKAGGPS
jgi:hypothetical protein